MLSTITSVISGRTKICDIDRLLIVGTSSLFNNVMQPMHELMTLLLYHHTGQTERYIWTDGIGLKKGNYSFYVDLQGYIYVHVN